MKKNSQELYNSLPEEYFAKLLDYVRDVFYYDSESMRHWNRFEIAKRIACGSMTKERNEYTYFKPTFKQWLILYYFALEHKNNS